MRKSFKTALKVILSLLLVVVLVALYILVPRHGSKIESEEWKGKESYNPQAVQTLTKEEGQPFKILMLSDLQLDVPFKNKDYLKSSIDKLVKDNNPDLIVLAGDNVAGVLMHFHIKTVVSIIDSYDIPWAVVFGNHDREFGNNLYYQAKQFMNAENCLFEVGPSNVDGLGNYVINVTENGHAVYSLFMIDSQSEIVTDTDKYFDNIHENQIQWYKDNVDAISEIEGHKVPSMAFFHIPVPEYKTAFDLAESGSNEAKILYGVRNEGECVPRDNSGFFDVFRENGGTHMFAAHDHGNNYSVEYKDVVLTYGTKTGDYSGHREDQMGGTLITINNDYSVTIDQIIIPLS